MPMVLRCTRAHLFFGDFEVAPEAIIHPVGKGSLLNLLPRVVHAFAAESVAVREGGLDVSFRHFFTPQSTLLQKTGCGSYNCARIAHVSIDTTNKSSKLRFQ